MDWRGGWNVPSLWLGGTNSTDYWMSERGSYLPNRWYDPGQILNGGDKAVEEGYSAFKVGRADNDEAVGDLIEMLLSISFACKDGMLDWDWLGIDLVEWPPQRLDWEIYRIDHLSLSSYMESSMMEWLEVPWYVGYAALKNMAVLDWIAQHMCPVCGANTRNKKADKDPWNFMTGAIQHFMQGTSCLGSLLNDASPDIHGTSLIPSSLELLQEQFPGKCARDFFHRQWPKGIKAMLDRFSAPLCMTRQGALNHLRPLWVGFQIGSLSIA